MLGINFKKLSIIVSEAAKGIDNLSEGAVGCAGYGFVFRDIDYITKQIDMSYSGGICKLGSIKKIGKDWEEDNIKEFTDFLRHNRNEDVLIAGAVKTLVPTLQFGGGYEHLFEVWMFVKTPEGKTFPVTLHYGQSGLVIGGWDPKIAALWISKKRNFPHFPKKFKAIINFSPHDLTQDETEALTEALELALQKVPVTDFFGVFMHDFGNLLMGIKDGKPIIVELGRSPKFSKSYFFLNLTLKLDIGQKEFESWEFH